MVGLVGEIGGEGVLSYTGLSAYRHTSDRECTRKIGEVSIALGAFVNRENVNTAYKIGISSMDNNCYSQKYMETNLIFILKNLIKINEWTIMKIFIDFI